MSASAGGQETHRAHFEVNAPTGGVTNDQSSFGAGEDREIVAVAIDDTGGSANVFGELSFRSQASLGSANNTDGARSATIVMGGQGLVVTGLSITWNAGEEIHIHTRNNSGATEQINGTVYYREL